MWTVAVCCLHYPERIEFRFKKKRIEFFLSNMHQMFKLNVQYHLGTYHFKVDI
jgi:hypothetical protein